MHFNSHLIFFAESSSLSETLRPTQNWMIPKMKRLSSLLSVLFLGAAAAQGAIVYSGPQNILIPQGGTTVFFDIETNATTTAPGGTTNWDFSILPQAGGGRVDPKISVDPDTFVFGSLDGFARAFNKGDSIKMYPTGLFDDMELDGFIGKTAFLGVNFADQFGFHHYAWVRIKQDGTIPSGGDITVIDWAWESALEDDIAAGAGIPVPEPATAWVAGAALAAIAARLRLRGGR